MYIQDYDETMPFHVNGFGAARMGRLARLIPRPVVVGPVAGLLGDGHLVLGGRRAVADQQPDAVGQVLLALVVVGRVVDGRGRACAHGGLFSARTRASRSSHRSLMTAFVSMMVSFMAMGVYPFWTFTILAIDAQGREQDAARVAADAPLVQPPPSFMQPAMIRETVTAEELMPGFHFTTFSYALSLLRPEIIRELDLLRPIYQKTAAYGHFGREEPEFSWERTDKAAALKAAAGL